MLLREQVLKLGIATALDPEMLLIKTLLKQDSLARNRLTYSRKSFVSLTNLQEI